MQYFFCVFSSFIRVLCFDRASFGALLLYLLMFLIHHNDMLETQHSRPPFSARRVVWILRITKIGWDNKVSKKKNIRCLTYYFKYLPEWRILAISRARCKNAACKKKGKKRKNAARCTIKIRRVFCNTETLFMRARARSDYTLAGGASGPSTRKLSRRGRSRDIRDIATRLDSRV